MKFSSRLSSIKVSSLLSVTVCVSDCVLEQLVHSHPSEHSLFFFMQPHREVVQPVLHLQPFRSWMTRCLTASMLLSLSQSKLSDSLVTFHPKLARGLRTMWLFSAFFHMSRTQHVHFQWRYSASVLGMISLSNCILSQIVCLMSSSQLQCCCNGLASVNLLKCLSGVVEKPEECFLK